MEKNNSTALQIGQRITAIELKGIIIEKFKEQLKEHNLEK